MNEKITATLETMSDSVEFMNRYHHLFKSSNIRACIENVYADIVDFAVSAALFYRQNTFRIRPCYLIPRHNDQLI